jgi:hypothetical protein
MDDNENPATSTVARTGFFPLVSGDHIEMRQAGAMALISRGDLSMSEAGGQLMVAGGDISMEQGGAQTILAKGDVTLREGGALVAAGATVTVRQGWVGCAIGRNVDLTGARLLLGPAQAAAFGAAAGVVAAVVGTLLARRGS